MVDYSRRMRPALGTYVEIGFPIGTDQSVVEQGFYEIQEIGRLMSRHDAASELSQVNDSNGKWLEVNTRTAAVLRLARTLTWASQGLFDCGVGELELRGRWVRSPLGKPISLDGIAKGYAVDCAVRKLQRLGLQSGWVNAGGDLKAFGECTLPIVRREGEGFKTIGRLNNGALATSEVAANDTRSDRFPGRIVSQVGLAPQVGTWTVVAKNAWLADALTKVACLASASTRAEFVESLGGLAVLES